MNQNNIIYKLATQIICTPQTSETRENPQHATQIEELNLSFIYNQGCTPFKSAVVRRHSTRPLRTCRLMRPARLDSSLITKRFGIRLKAINMHFNEIFTKQLGETRLRKVEPRILETIETQVTQIQEVFYGLRNPIDEFEIHKPTLSQDSEEIMPNNSVKLIPESEWVYKTPHNQRIKKMEELNFTPVDNPCKPAILYGSKDLHEMQPAELFYKGKHILIDPRYLSPECTLTTTDGAISPSNISSWYMNLKSPELDKENLSWYEERMRAMASCRPKRLRPSFKSKLCSKYCALMNKFEEKKKKIETASGSGPCKLQKLNGSN